MKYSLFNEQGEITCTGNSDMGEDDFLLLNPFTIFDTLDQQLQYVDRLSLLALYKPTQQTTLNKLTLTADGIDTITISDAPSGAFTATNAATHETVTGAINDTDTFSTTIPGTYSIKIESWPFLDFTTTIEAI